MGKGPDARSRRLKGESTRRGTRTFVLLLALVILTLIGRPLHAALEPMNDAAPYVISTYPAANSVGVPPSVTLIVTFSEPVELADNAVSLGCSASPTLALAVSGGPAIYALTPDRPLVPDESCIVTVSAHLVSDVDTLDPPDNLTSDWYGSFTVSAPQASDVIINELDAVTGVDGHEYIELYDGGAGNTLLNGLQLALYDGATDSLITNAVLTGYRTDTNGYFLISTDPATADLRLAKDALPDGPAAVAIYTAPGGSLPIGSPVIITGLVDAIVYDSGQPDDAGLLPLLLAGEPQVDESSMGQATLSSSQRCPNGTGEQRRTSTYRQGAPSPGIANHCVTDSAPAVIQLQPSDGATLRPAEVSLILAFSEPVSLAPGAIELICGTGDEIGLELSGGPVIFEAAPTTVPDHGVVCSATVFGHLVRDTDSDDPPDLMVSDVSWSFATAMQVAGHMLINEVDTDTPGSDTAEFIELYDGGTGNTDLNGLTVVLFNGSDDKSYRAISLDGQKTDAGGYFVIGNAGVAGRDLDLPNGAIQNGPDAVALYASTPADFPNGTAVTSSGLLDAFVYGPTSTPDAGLLVLLEPGETQMDENGRGAADQHASQRCPNGTGGQRRTGAFRPSDPTPGAANVCTIDDPPRVVSTSPLEGAKNVALDTSPSLTFDEPVSVKKGGITLKCTISGDHVVVVSGGPENFTVSPVASFSPSETCSLRVVAKKISDLDNDDPPDAMTADLEWSFTTSEPAADFVMINEIDTNTPGLDQAEFVELFDGGGGQTALDGLTLVLFNGNGDVSYKALSLEGQQTDAAGYFVIGSAEVPGVDLVVADSTIQNGPDAIALYAAGAGSFPADTRVTTNGLLDAVVYGEEADTGLLPLLHAGQTAVNESSSGSADSHSLQRCPNGSGGQRNTSSIGTGVPTPGKANGCLTDTAPELVDAMPLEGSTGVAIDQPIALEFSEPVALAADAVDVTCSRSGVHGLVITGGPVKFFFTPVSPFLADESCSVTLAAAGVTDLDTIDPPDAMVTGAAWKFQTAAQPTNATMLINEFDVDTPSTDTAEFIELYDGGLGNQALDGLVLVLFNGSTDTSYRMLDLTGARTDSAGYLVIGGPDIAGSSIELPAGTLQNGPDAIAIFAASPAHFSNGAAITLDGILDALVYGTGDPPDSGLLALLLPDQPQIDEDSLGNSAEVANQRCPNGAGATRTTTGFIQAPPSPGEANRCEVADAAPGVAALTPADGAVVAKGLSELTVTFSEEVTLDKNWIHLSCDTSGNNSLSHQAGPVTFNIMLARPLAPGEQCEASIVARRVHDTDTADPPDTLADNVTWSFAVESAECDATTTPIPAIQGTASVSPLVGKTVTVEGVVSGDFHDGLGGFFVQSPFGEDDGDPATSEGLFVTLATSADKPVPGERLLLQGLVAETNQRTALVDAEIVATCGSGEHQVPQSVSIPDLSSGWESLESMLVTLGPLTIVDNHDLVSQGELTLTVGERPMYPTDVEEPGAAAQAQLDANRARFLILDDGRIELPPSGTPLTPDNQVRAGDNIPSLTGILDGYGGHGRLHPTEPHIVQPTNPRPQSPMPTGDALRIAGVDLGDFVNGIGTGNFIDPAGAQSLAEYLRQRDKVVAMLSALDADVIAMVGLENDGTGANSAVADLLYELNTTQPAAGYAVLDGSANEGSTYARQSAIFYRADRLDSLSISTLGSSVASIGMVALPTLASFQDVESGEDFSLLLVHLAPRDDCPTNGPNADQEDGQACNNRARTEAAQEIGQWLAATGDPGQTLVLGNWNAYRHEDPMQAFVVFGTDPLERTATSVSGYDYTQLDQGHLTAPHRVLAGTRIATQVQQLAIWHINADESPGFDYRLVNPPALYTADPHRATAADPVLIDLARGRLRAEFAATTPTLIGDAVHFFNQSIGPGPLRYTWDFGDGSPPVTARDPHHTYVRIGTYQVILTVENGYDRVNTTGAVDVVPRRIYLPSVAAGSR